MLLLSKKLLQCKWLQYMPRILVAFIPVRNSSCGKVMFSQASVCPQGWVCVVGRGVCGEGGVYGEMMKGAYVARGGACIVRWVCIVKGGACVAKGACMAKGGHVW